MNPAEAMSPGEVTLANSSRPVGRAGAGFRQASQVLGLLVLGAASYYVISHFFLQTVSVVGVSMAPTLHESERYLLNRWIYYVRKPQRADVVVIRDPFDRGYSVKRVVAAPGDTVCLKDGQVYVNGQRLKEPYLAAGTPTFPERGAREQSFQCGSAQYFLLGDNRKNSVDSRNYGPVAGRDILGRVVP